MTFWYGSGSGSIPLWQMDPDSDPGGSKTCGSGGSISGTRIFLLSTKWSWTIKQRLHFNHRMTTLFPTWCITCLPRYHHVDCHVMSTLFTRDHPCCWRMIRTWFRDHHLFNIWTYDHHLLKTRDHHVFTVWSSRMDSGHCFYVIKHVLSRDGSHVFVCSSLVSLLRSLYDR